jgi:hypothetical protein
MFPGTSTSSGGSDGSSSGGGGGGGGGGSGSRAGLPDGLPGTVCDEKDAEDMRRQGYDGVCWNPPGSRSRSRMPKGIVAGRRKLSGTVVDEGTDVYWFDMPDVEPRSPLVALQGDRPDWTWVYAPYEDDEGDGLPRFDLPQMVGLDVEAALDQLDALDQPLVVTVRWDQGCERGHGKVCDQGDEPQIRRDGHLDLIVATDVLDAGTADETRRYPDTTGMKTDEALADLARRGFTNVKVVEDPGVPCERGVVCQITPSRASFYPVDTEITLTVRTPKKK